MDNKTIEVATYRPLPKQIKAHLSPALDLLYGGAKGGGKSVWLCNEAMRLCSRYPGNKIWMGRKQAVDFTKTTLETFRTTIPAPLYTINEQKKIIAWNGDAFGGSRIFYGGCDRQEEIISFNSAEYGAALLDQVEELTEKDYGMIKATLRYKLPNGQFPSLQMRNSANPSQGWLKSKFILSPTATTEFIQALPGDNPFLPPSYEQNLRDAFKFRPAILRAFLEGSWDELDADNVAIRMQDIERAVNRVLASRETAVFLSVDVSRLGDDETVIYIWQGLRIIDQLITGQKRMHELAIIVGELMIKHNAVAAVIDADGVGGGLCDILKGQGRKVIEIHGAEKSSNPERWVNRRAEIWWEAADRFYGGDICIPNDPELIRQLNAVTYFFASGNRIQIIDKEQIKQKLLGLSPDRAESCIYGIEGYQKLLREDLLNESRPQGNEYAPGTSERALKQQTELALQAARQERNQEIW